MSEKRIVTVSGPVPSMPTIAQQTAIMEAVNRQLGERWVVVRMDGVWVFKNGEEAGVVSRRTFKHALADSVGCTLTILIKSGE